MVMNVSTVIPRRSKYCDAIASVVAQLGHATNAEIIDTLRESFPGLSATTVHRATTRMAQRAELAMAPKDLTGAMRYDSNLLPHDHFMCDACGGLRDIQMPRELVEMLENQLDGCTVDGGITFSGRCHVCKKRSENG